jgi:hypothetical protein
MFSAKRFAQMFVTTRNGEETARNLGAAADEAREMGARMLCDGRVKREIRKLDEADEQSLCYARTGLSRLAFGSVNGAVALMFDDEVNYDKIMAADLFNVSEIKRVKGGGIEMKFFDRQKAIEKLAELDPEFHESTGAREFLEAVTRQDGNFTP